MKTLYIGPSGRPSVVLSSVHLPDWLADMILIWCGLSCNDTGRLVLGSVLADVVRMYATGEAATRLVEYMKH